MGLKKLLDIVDKGEQIVQEAVIDKDKAIELENTLQSLRAQLLLSGSGAGVTKVTICALVSIIVITGTVCFIIGKDMSAFKEYASAVTPIIGVLIGVYGAGKALTTKWNNK